jgi:hypothetical protein
MYWFIFKSFDYSHFYSFIRFTKTWNYTFSRLQQQVLSPLRVEEQHIIRFPHLLFSLSIAVLNSALNNPYINGLTALFFGPVTAILLSIRLYMDCLAPSLERLCSKKKEDVGI